MNYKKLSLYIFILFSSIAITFAYTVSFTGPTCNVQSYYCSPNSASCTSLGASISHSSISPFTYNFDSGASSAIWKISYFTQSNKRIIPKSPYSIYGFGSTTVSLPAFTGYKTSLPNDFKTGSTCQVSSTVIPLMPTSTTSGNFNIIFNSNLDYLKLSTETIVPLPISLEQYYHMKAKYKVEAVGGFSTVTLKPWTVMTLKEYNVPITETFFWNYSTLPADTYYIKVSWETPSSVEPKCTGLEWSGNQLFGPITITSPISYTWDVSSWSMCTPTGTSCSLSLNSVPGEQTRTAICTDSIGTPVSNSFCISAGLPMPQTNQPCTQVCDVDSDTVGNLDDWCKTQSWEELGHTATSSSQFQGCPYEYTSLGCTGDVLFNEIKLKCDHYDCSFCNNDNYFKFGGSKVSPSHNTIVYYLPIQSTGVYSCYNENWFGDSMVGNCNLRHNLNPTLTCNIMQGLTPLFSVPMSTSLKVYKYGSMLPGEFSNPAYFESVTCSGTSYTLIMPVSYSNPINLSGIEYINVIRNPQGNLVENDSTTNGKLSCDTQTNICYINTTQSGLQEINLSGIENTSNYIKIIKNGINIRNDTVDILSLALEAHKIESFKNTSEAEHFIEKSYDIMTKFNITKNLTYNSFTGKTKVEISMESIPSSDRQNLTLYIIVPKQVATSLSSITNIQEGNGQFFVKDKDPIIGWYFNESEDNETVSVEVPGETEGGSILITQTPILYNEGELIINYREDSCNLGELELFELEDLIDSKVYSPGSAKLYKVCITHLNPAVILNFGSAPLSVDVMSYDDGQNASQDTNQLSNKIILNSNDNNLYWDVKVQKTNPSGNYSCIGSFDIQNSSSLFGDCGYKENNRLWIHLGADYNPPITTVSYPYLSHTMKVILTAFEPSWESGVKQITYRIVEDNLTFTTILSNTTEFFVTCQNDWGCKKTIEYYAEDNAGNIETLKTRELPLIDKGSACQADCSARPAPNRYLKECRNLNGCEYFTAPWELGENKGEHVANACDYLTIGSWGRYNLTHDILCPSGPFIESRFTNQLVDLLSESDCENLVKTPYPIIIDGEQAILNIVSCINEK